MDQVREGDAPGDHRRHAHHGGGANGEPVSAVDHAAHWMMSPFRLAARSLGGSPDDGTAPLALTLSGIRCLLAAA